MDPLSLLIIFFVSVFVGVITSMLGIGEGVLLVPFLTLAAGIPIQIAIATSLVSTIANSSAASMTYVKDCRLNLRLALWFAITATAGAIIGAQIAAQINRTLLTEVFAAALGAQIHRSVSRRFGGALGHCSRRPCDWSSRRSRMSVVSRSPGSLCQSHNGSSRVSYAGPACCSKRKVTRRSSL